MRTVKPEQVGIDSTYVTNFLASIHKRKLPMHSLLLLRGDQLFLEAYWAPYTKDSIQRMYSSTKSFVSIGVGLAQEDGLIDLDKPIASYFPEKLSDDTDPEVLALTVRQMLTMTTAGHPGNWFADSIKDRTQFYFRKRLNYLHPAGTRWHYDSPGSQVLCALVEKVTGKNFLAYMQERLFCHMDAFQNARMLKIGNGDSWGDSAMLCTSRDFAKFALFTMRLGNWNGKQILNKDYVQTATSRVVDNTLGGFCSLYTHGYGYQFWRTEKDGFAMIGMGGQMAICLPKQDLILVCTADLQGIGYARDYIIAQFLDLISDHLQDTPLLENPEQLEKLDVLRSSLALYSLNGMPDSPLRKDIDGAVYQCTPKGLEWEQFSLQFDGADGGVLQYVKKSGVKKLPFYINRNRFCKFPEEGYSGEFGGQVTTDGSLYDAAVSAAWVQSNKLLIHVQIVDDYLGHLLLDIGFRDDKAVVTAMKYAENFMNDYKGEAVGVRVKQK